MVILGLLDTYYDEQVKPNECRQSLQRILRTLRELAKQNIHVLIADVEVAEPPKGKENLFQLVRNAVDIVTILEPRYDGFHFINYFNRSEGASLQRATVVQVNSFTTKDKERRKQLWDETTIHSRSSSIKTEMHGANSAED